MMSVQVASTNSRHSWHGAGPNAVRQPAAVPEPLLGVEVTDVTQLYEMLDTAIAENPAPKTAAKPRTTAHK